MKFVISIILAICFSCCLNAQDVQLSQYYATGLYNNPGFTGSGHLDRVTFHNRLQWPGIQAKFISSFLAYDRFIDDFNSGVGGALYYDRQGSGQVTNFEALLSYAYVVHLTRDWALRMGLQGALARQVLDYSNLQFTFQFDDNGPNGLGNGLDGERNQKIYGDINTGYLLFNQNMWFGVSAHHLNRPDLSVFENQSRLPIRYSFIGGYRFKLNKTQKLTFEDHPTDISISPTFHYKMQGKSDQLDLGLYGVYDHFLFGLWYRGIPIKTFENLQNNEAIIAMVGWKVHKQMEIRYSYDITTSSLTNANPGGAHEISISYLFNGKPSTAKFMKRLPCPDHHVIEQFNYL